MDGERELTTRLEQGYGCDLKPVMAPISEDERRGLLARIVKLNAEDRKQDPSLPELKVDEYPKASATGVAGILGKLGVDLPQPSNSGETKSLMLLRTDPTTQRDVTIYNETFNYSQNIYKPLCGTQPRY